VRSFFKANDLKWHEMTHTGEKSFGCMTCGKLFPRKSNLKRYEKTHFQTKPL